MLHAQASEGPGLTPLVNGDASSSWAKSAASSAAAASSNGAINMTLALTGPNGAPLDRAALQAALAQALPGVSARSDPFPPALLFPPNTPCCSRRVSLPRMKPGLACAGHMTRKASCERDTRRWEWWTGEGE